MSDPDRPPKKVSSFPFCGWKDCVYRVPHPEEIIGILTASPGLDIVVSPDPAFLLRLYFQIGTPEKPVYHLIRGQTVESLHSSCRALAAQEEDDALIFCSPEYLMTRPFHSAVQLRAVRSVVIPDAHRAFCQDTLFAPQIFLAGEFHHSLVTRPAMLFLSDAYPADQPETVLAESFGLIDAGYAEQKAVPALPTFRVLSHKDPLTDEALREALCRLCSSVGGNVVVVCPDADQAERVYSLLSDRFSPLLCTGSQTVRDMARTVRGMIRMTEEERFLTVTDVRSVSGCPTERIGFLVYTALPRSRVMLTRTAMRLPKDAVCTILCSSADIFTVGRRIDYDLTEDDYAVPDEECRRFLREERIRELGILSSVLTGDRCLPKELAPTVGCSMGRRCGVCSACDPAGDMIDCSEAAVTILRIVGTYEMRFSAHTLERFLCGTLSDRPALDALRNSPGYGCLRSHDREDVRLFVTLLIRKRYLTAEVRGSSFRLRCSRLAALLLTGSDKLWIPEAELHAETDKAVSAILSRPADPDLYRLLKALRISLAARDGIPTYAVFGNSVLHALSADPPADIKALAEIPRFPKENVSVYGENILACIRSHSKAQDT